MGTQYRGLNFSLWLTFQVVELLFQRTGGIFVFLCNLAYIPRAAHLFFNSLHTQQQERQVRDGEREEQLEGGINMGDDVKMADHRNRQMETQERIFN